MSDFAGFGRVLRESSPRVQSDWIGLECLSRSPSSLLGAKGGAKRRRRDERERPAVGAPRLGQEPDFETTAEQAVRPLPARLSAKTAFCALFAAPRSGAIRGTIGRAARWEDTKRASFAAVLGFRAYRHAHRATPLASGVSPDARPPVSCTPPRPPKSDIASSNLFFPPDRPLKPRVRFRFRLRYRSSFETQGRRARPPSAGAARPDDARAVPGVRRPGGRRRRRLGRRGGRAGG